MPTADELKQLSRLRLEEAEVLHASGLHAGAYYLCGYILELALKACVCKTLGVSSYPETEMKGSFKTHRWEDLILLSGLRDALGRQRASSSVFDANWSAATNWSPEQRYQLSRAQTDAQDIIEAFRSAPEGVLVWLSSQW